MWHTPVSGLGSSRDFCCSVTSATHFQRSGLRQERWVTFSMNKSYDTGSSKFGPPHRYKATPMLFRSLRSRCLLTGSIVGLIIVVQAAVRPQTAPMVGPSPLRSPVCISPFGTLQRFKASSTSHRILTLCNLQISPGVWVIMIVIGVEYSQNDDLLHGLCGSYSRREGPADGLKSLLAAMRRVEWRMGRLASHPSFHGLLGVHRI